MAEDRHRTSSATPADTHLEYYVVGTSCARACSLLILCRAQAPIPVCPVLCIDCCTQPGKNDEIQRLLQDTGSRTGGLALAFKLFERIHGLEVRLYVLDAQLPHQYK